MGGSGYQPTAGAGAQHSQQRGMPQQGGQHPQQGGPGPQPQQRHSSGAATPSSSSTTPSYAAAPHRVQSQVRTAASPSSPLAPPCGADARPPVERCYRGPICRDPLGGPQRGLRSTLASSQDRERCSDSTAGCAVRWRHPIACIWAAMARVL